MELEEEKKAAEAPEGPEGNRMFRACADWLDSLGAALAIVVVLFTVVLRVPIAYGLAYITRSPELPNGSYDSLYYSLLISWVMTTVITAVFFKRGKWRKKAEAMFKE